MDPLQRIVISQSCSLGADLYLRKKCQDCEFYITLQYGLHYAEVCENGFCNVKHIEII